MKTILATLIAAVLAVCATVWPPATTTDTTPTIEPPPTVAAETAPVEPQPAPHQEQPNPKLQTGPNQPTATVAPAPTPKEAITEEKEIAPVAKAPEPIVKEVIVPQPPMEEPSIVEHAKTDIETVIEHAKTGYEEELPAKPPIVEPEPPAQTADIDAAIAAAESFAIETYDVTIDSSLNFTNSAYRFPAVVPLTVDQNTLNNKAVDIVDYTFQQQMRQYGVALEKMQATGIRCKVHVVQNEQDYQIYCLYA